MFHPHISTWFDSRFDGATDIQTMSWEAQDSNSQNLLICAPTGSGKTLAAFLYQINALISRQEEYSETRVLYISPLKALNNDVHKNLISPLREIEAIFRENKDVCPEVNVAVRSGDTSQNDRRRMLKKPPHILITTPESLHMMLSSGTGRNALQGIQTVIIDEIHNIAENKRGTLLSACLERLRCLSGDFSRIAISATVNPLDKIAAFAAGCRQDAAPRDYEIITSSIQKEYRLDIRFANSHADDEDPYESSLHSGIGTNWLDALSGKLLSQIKKNKSTLIFTNSRRRTETLAAEINRLAGQKIALSHHGSLSKEIRHEVENRMKEGELKAIVATSSLELGIDIGSIDSVSLIQTPFDTAACIQRLGRGGHSVGAVSHGVLYPLFPEDLLASVIMYDSVLNNDLDPLNIPESPLDLIPQFVIGELCTGAGKLQPILEMLKSSYSYRSLSKEDFYGVIKMLAGEYADSRIAELKSRIIYNEDDDTAELLPGTLQLIYMNGGTIPDHGYYKLQLRGYKGTIGELDEEFVWERSVGDVFTLGNQSWRVENISDQTVEVSPAAKQGRGLIPFWKAETPGRSRLFMHRMADVIGGANSAEDISEYINSSLSGVLPAEDTRTVLASYLQRQANSAGLPNRQKIIIEYCIDTTKDLGQIAVHSLWGRFVNNPLGAIIQEAWLKKRGFKPQMNCNDMAIVFLVPESEFQVNPLELIRDEDIMSLLGSHLEETGLFGASFRENAARSLLLPRRSFKRRVPLWVNRMKAKKLLRQTAHFKDFPVTKESWRECLNDQLDIEGLNQLIQEFIDGEIIVERKESLELSPFAASLEWDITNSLLYQDDSQPGMQTDTIIQGLLKTAIPDIQIDEDVNEEFRKRRQRLIPDYLPATEAALKAYIRDRLFLLPEEWDELKKLLIEQQSDAISAEKLDALVKEYHFPDGEIVLYNCKKEDLQDQNFESWIQHYGLIKIDQLRKIWGPAIDLQIQLLLESDVLIEGSDNRICLKENFEQLIRMQRRKKRTALPPRDIDELPGFMAFWAGIYGPRKGRDIYTVLDSLLGYPMQAQLIEQSILPARLPEYRPDMLDKVFSETELCWYGAGEKKAAFASREDMQLFAPPPPRPSSLIQDTRGYYSFWSIKDKSGLDTNAAVDTLWKESWQGKLGSTEFINLRNAVQRGFKRNPAERGNLRSWQKSTPLQGNWFALETKNTASESELEVLELKKSKIKQLLRRHGIIFRELLKNESKGNQMRDLIEALRIMELSGEVVGGYFYKDIPGLQFIAPEALPLLNDLSLHKEWFWINAADPNSAAGLKIPGYPHRKAGIHILHFAQTAVLTVEGKKITVISKLSGPEAEKIPDQCFSMLQSILHFSSKESFIKIQLIDEQKAWLHPLGKALKDRGMQYDGKSLVLWKDIGNYKLYGE